MNAALATALLLALGTLLGLVRSWRARPPRVLLRSLLQVAVALALWLCLWPPSLLPSFRPDQLTVLTPAATPAQIAGADAAAVVLPGVVAPAALEPVADLATALRHHPQAQRLRVIGGGLPARDRDAARGRLAAFDAAPLPPGIVELAAPGVVGVGARWRLTGRVNAAPGARVELHDPAGAVAASAPTDAQGQFELDVTAKAAGTVDYSLRALDARGAVLDTLPVPLAVRAGERLRLLLLAGAPAAQLKYLRRWALDAGLDLDSRIDLSTGIALREGDARLDPATLAATDLVIIDERAWAGLDDARKQALHDAVAAGLGLLLRASGPLPPAVAQDWRALGFATTATAAREVAVAHALGASPPLVLTALPLVPAAADAAVLLRGDDGTPLALWRASGRGRVGMIGFDGDWKFVLGGTPAAQAGLWSALVTQLARAHATAAPQLPQRAQVGERAVLCGVADGDEVEDSQGRRSALLAVAGPAATQCAAYWPVAAGWHALVRGTGRWPFAVLADAADGALARAARADATQALLGALPATDAGAAARARALPRWPFWLAFLGLAGLLWWLERPRH